MNTHQKRTRRIIPASHKSIEQNQLSGLEVRGVWAGRDDSCYGAEADYEGCGEGIFARAVVDVAGVAEDVDGFDVGDYAPWPGLRGGNGFDFERGAG